jgi:hypothetical protein
MSSIYVRLFAPEPDHPGSKTGPAEKAGRKTRQFSRIGKLLKVML